MPALAARKEIASQLCVYVLSVPFKGDPDGRFVIGITDMVEAAMREHTTPSTEKRIEKRTLVRGKHTKRYYFGAKLAWKCNVRDRAEAERLLASFSILQKRFKQEVVSGNYSSNTAHILEYVNREPKTPTC